MWQYGVLHLSPFTASSSSSSSPSANPSHSQSKVPLDNEHDGLVVSLEHVTTWDRFIVQDCPSTICGSGSPLGLIDQTNATNLTELCKLD